MNECGAVDTTPTQPDVDMTVSLDVSEPSDASVGEHSSPPVSRSLIIFIVIFKR